MTDETNRLARIGRIQLAAIFSYLILTSIGLFLWRVQGEIDSAEFTDGLRFVLEIGLLIAVWRGWRWAKLMMVLLLSAAAVWTAFLAQGALRPEEARVIVIALSVFYGFIAVALVASRSINAHLDCQRLGQSSPKDA